MATKKGADWKSQKHTLIQRRDAIQEMKSQYNEEDTVALLRLLQECRDEEQRLDMEAQRVSERIEAIQETVVDQWTATGLSSMTVAGVGAFSLHTKLYVSQGDKTQYLQWLRDNEMGALIQESVPPKTSEALVRERLEDGQPCDEMGLSISYKLTVR